MMFPMIRCYHVGAIIPPHSFFILCKGCNAGMPGSQPWANSFIVVCPHKEYYEFYFWLVYGLHKSGKFKTRHRGSAIPFINLEDARDLIREIAPDIQPDWKRFQEILDVLNKLEKRKATLKEQILASTNLQQSLIRMYFNKIK